MPNPAVITSQPIFGLPGLSKARGVIVPPTMTSDTAPAPYVAAASTELNPYNAWQAFGPARANLGWLNSAGALPQWISVKLPYPFLVATYWLYPWWTDNFPGRTPTAWTLQGSNDGSTWTIIDTQSGVTWPDTTTTHTYTLTVPAPAFTTFRLNITANGGDGYTGLGQFQLSGRRF